MTINELKELRYSEIDDRSQELIFEGFNFQGLKFSMSLSAQINWSNLFNIPDSHFPLSLMDKNENIYSLQLSERVDFYASAMNHKNSILQSGSVLKAQIKNSITVSQINSIIDNR